MVIKNIFSNKNISVIEGNKKRMECVRNAINNNVFNKLEYILDNKNKQDIKVFLQENMFYEFINEDFFDEFIRVVEANDEIINDLIESYKLRGVKGIRFCWGSVIRRYS